VLAERMVREYATELYVPLAERGERLSADGFKRAKELARWRQQLATGWHDVEVQTVHGDEGVAEIGQRRDVEVTVALGSLTPDDVCVELLHGSVRADGALESPEVMALTLEGRDGDGYRYRGGFEVDGSGEYGLAVRVVPAHPDLTSWADTGLVSWADSERLGTGADSA
jgi:starch phosphorylase